MTHLIKKSILTNLCFRAKRLLPLQDSRGALMYFLGPELNLTEDGYINHAPGHIGNYIIHISK